MGKHVIEARRENEASELGAEPGRKRLMNMAQSQDERTKNTRHATEANGGVRVDKRVAQARGEI